MEPSTNTCNCGKGCSSYCVGGMRTAALVLVGLLSLFVLVKTVNAVKEYGYIGKTEATQNVITVSGKGEVISVPDIATFSFSIVEEALVIADAQKEATDKMNAAIKSLKDAGVAEKDIKTSYYNIYPRYEYRGQGMYTVGTRYLAAYEVSQGVEVKIRKVEDAGKILASLGELGVSNLSGLNFTVDDPEVVQREARDAAIADARDQAEKLAKALGVKLVGIMNYSESGNYPYPVYYRDAAMNQASYGMGGAEKAPELPTGENKIVSNVSITYEIR
jgi:uncharacterized protein